MLPSLLFCQFTASRSVVAHPFLVVSLPFSHFNFHFHAHPRAAVEGPFIVAFGGFLAGCDGMRQLRVGNSVAHSTNGATIRPRIRGFGGGKEVEGILRMASS